MRDMVSAWVTTACSPRSPTRKASNARQRRSRIRHLPQRILIALLQVLLSRAMGLFMAVVDRRLDLARLAPGRCPAVGAAIGCRAGHRWHLPDRKSVV